MTKVKYWALFALQTMGAIMLLWTGVPLYRNLLTGAADTEHRNLIWSLFVIALIQPAFWIARTIRPAIRKRDRARVFSGHVVLFLSRITFLFVGSVFSALFYNRASHIEARPAQIGLVLALLFSMFCYTLEVERLGRNLIDEDREPQKKE